MHLTLRTAAVLLVLAGSTYAAPEQTEERDSEAPRPYVGVRLNSQIPELVRKHLQLEPEQGLLVENIYRGGPADKAGLDKDDILLTMNGQPLKSPREVFRNIHEIGIGGSVVVDLIHLGQRKTVTITLEQRGPEFRSDRSGWKYALEPDESMIIRPGRMFRMQPGERDWIEIPMDQIKEGDAHPPTLGAQYHFLHDDGQKEFTVIIDGNPSDPDASITVKTPDKEYFTIVGQVDKLPQEYQQTVRLDIEKAKKSFDSGRTLKIPSHFDFSRWEKFFADGGRGPRPEMRGPDMPGPRPPATKEDLQKRLDFVNQQIERLQQQQKELQDALKEKQE